MVLSRAERYSSSLASERDGSNAIERKAVYRAQLEIQAMPASVVVQIALWPDKLADWAKEMNVAAPVVYNMLANVKPYHRVRTLLAKRLNVTKAELDHLIEAPRPQPLSRIPPDPPLADPPPGNPQGGDRNRSHPPRPQRADAVSSAVDPPRRRDTGPPHPRPERRRPEPANPAGQTRLEL